MTPRLKTIIELTSFVVGVLSLILGLYSAWPQIEDWWRRKQAQVTAHTPEQIAKQHYDAGTTFYNAGRLPEAIEELTAVLALPASSPDAGYVFTARNLLGKIYLQSSPPRCDKAAEQLVALAGVDGNEFAQEIQRLFKNVGCSNE